MKIVALSVALLLTVVTSATAERARTPADATVFIRVSVKLQAEIIDGPGLHRRIDKELYRMSGSGFVISAYGHVLTNAHVIMPPALKDVAVVDPGVTLTGTVSVAGIAVCFPRESAAWNEVIAQPDSDQKCLDASVVAEDHALDLATLSVSASNLPYLGLGDSDMVVGGQAEEVFGFPLGAQLEIGKGTGNSDVVPSVTRTGGTVSALRMGCGTAATSGTCATAADSNSQRRFLQVSNAINPGNSGGPVVDRHGFVIGVVQSKIIDKDGAVEGLGFAIPINVVKDFLEERGLDTALPVRRMRLGPVQTLDVKRLRMALPDGFTDVAAFASRVEAESLPSSVSLRIDRVLSPWTVQRLDDELTGTPVFERASWGTHEGQASSRTGRMALRTGLAAGELANAAGVDAWMLYGLVDLGPEKLVARYVGPAEWLAFNESVFVNSIATLDGQRLAVPGAASIERLKWSPSTDAEGRSVLPIPVGWSVAADGPATCARLPRPSTAGSASPVDDFGLSLRAATWTERELTPAAAATLCGEAGSQPGASYTSQFEYLGARYVVEGVFVRSAPDRLVRMEVTAPDTRRAFGRALLAAWVKRIAP